MPRDKSRPRDDRIDYLRFAPVLGRNRRKESRAASGLNDGFARGRESIGEVFTSGRPAVHAQAAYYRTTRHDACALRASGARHGGDTTSPSPCRLTRPRRRAPGRPTREVRVSFSRTWKRATAMGRNESSPACYTQCSKPSRCCRYIERSATRPARAVASGERAPIAVEVQSAAESVRVRFAVRVRPFCRRRAPLRPPERAAARGANAVFASKRQN